MAVSSSKGEPDCLHGDLRAADVIVAAGRGAGGPEGIALIARFARAVGAQVAATRGAVDAGWLPRDREIGLSGKRVAPELYIACGVAGANFHTIGMEHSRTVIAVNRDPKARIFELADIAIVGEMGPCLTQLLSRLPRDAGAPTVAQIVGLFQNYLDLMDRNHAKRGG